jgi:hypothetical protein
MRRTWRIGRPLQSLFKNFGRGTTQPSDRNFVGRPATRIDKREPNRDPILHFFFDARVAQVAANAHGQSILCLGNLAVERRAERMQAALCKASRKNLQYISERDER